MEKLNIQNNSHSNHEYITQTRQLTQEKKIGFNLKISETSGKNYNLSINFALHRRPNCFF